MKKHLQIIINVCFAISITAFIYQNDKQQDRINTLDQKIEYLEKTAGGGQLSLLEVVVESHADNWKQQDTYNKGLKDLSDVVADSINDYETEIQDITESITDIESTIRKMPKPKSTQAIKNIIKGCELH